MLRYSVVLIWVTLLGLSACDSGTETRIQEIPEAQIPEAQIPEETSSVLPRISSSCEKLYPSNKIAGQVLWDGFLPTDGTAFESVEILNQPRGLLSDVDAATGYVSYAAASGSRLPDRISYAVRDASNNVLSIHHHYLFTDFIRIMPLGDSITHGIDFFDGAEHPPVPLRVGYRKSLYDRIVASGFAVDFIGQGGQRAGYEAGLKDADNNGYPGVDIGFIASKVSQVLNEGPSDVVLLHIGSNQTPPVATELLTILDQIDIWSAENFPVQVYVSTLVPKRDPTLQLTVDAFNEDLRRLIAERAQSSVILVENALALSIDDISSESVGVHPNVSGYERMAKTWMDALSDKVFVSACHNNKN